MTRIPTISAALTATILGTTGASATIFSKDYHGPGVWNSYDTVAQTYTMKFNDNGSKDGFWLVVSDGENPKSNANEYAILYGDRAANRITAYNYNGENKADSFRTGDVLGTFDNVFSTANGQTMFSLDVSGINGAYDDAEWDGVGFGQQTGIWFHQSSGSEFAYNADGSIADYSYGGQMWLDTAHDGTGARVCGKNDNRFFCSPNATAPTNPGGGDGNGGGSVPAPGGLALVLMGLAGFRLRRKS